MRYIYSFLLLCLVSFAQAQTNPAPQTIPYTQDFSALTAASTTYPAGWQGWTISIAPGSTFNTAAPTADRALIANSTAATNSGNIHNYNGKIGFLNTGSLDLGLVLALSTTGQSNVAVGYDVMTIRNPYDGTTNTRINEVTFQYRVGTTGAFTNFTGIEYQNNTTTQTTALTTPQNVISKTITLPAACDNQPVVQLRWASRQVNGGGARPSFAVDNITAGGAAADVTPPVVSSLSPADDATNVSTSTQLIINFSEAIQKNTGNILIKKSADNSIVQTIDVTAAAVSVTGNVATISINTLNPATGYYVEIASGAFKDLAGNLYAGITGNTLWNFTTGTTIYNADFNTCTASLTDGFTAYSVTGAQVWACTTFGHDAANPANSAPNGVQINGFAGGTNVLNEDWLISPPLNLVSTAYPLLSFWSRTKFNGVPLQLKVSVNYPGTGNPNNYTWNDLNGRFPQQTSDIWTLSQNISLEAYKTATTYIAFVYNSSADDGARWTLDDVKIDNSPTPPPASLTPNTGDVVFGFTPSGNTAVKTMIFTGNDLTGPVSLTATGNFLISKTNGSFTSTLSYTQSEANNIAKTVYVQFAPTAPNQEYTGNLTISTPTVTDTIINLKGNSIDPANTLEVVNWNIEWFGSTTLGPTDDNLQEQNIKTIAQNIGADVYALEEVVSEPRLANIVSQMPGYSYVLSNYGSHTNASEPGAGPLSEAQKLGLIYKTSLFPGGVTTQPLLSAGINTAADLTNPAYNWYASGRFPFMVTGTTTLNGITKTLRFIVIHAKANTSPTATSYARRKAGADSLRINLNLFYPNDNLILLGDFNDDLDSTITDGIHPRLSSYKSFVDDAADFYSPTLALSLAGKKSTVSYNDVIDHVMLSNEMKCSYLPGSATILTDVSSLVTNYGTTTTDHYPVFTRYLFQAASSAAISYAGTPYCSNAGMANVSFTGTAGGTYSSTTGLSINATTGAVNLSASTAGTYTVTYFIAGTDACNPAYSTGTTITINPAPAATIIYTGTPYCQSTTAATVTRTGTASGTYSSATGLNINTTNGDINTATSTPGTYIVTYIIGANGGCAVFTTTASVTINSLSAAPVGANASSTLICGNTGTVNLSVTGGTLGSGASYKWYTGTCGGILLGTGATLTNINVNATTTFYVRAEGSCNNTACANVTVIVAPAPVVDITVTPSTTVTPSSPALITATVSPAGNYVYQWYKNGNLLPGNTERITVTADQAGTYKVIVSASGSCSVTSADAVITAAVTPALFISPNPNHGIFNVSINNGNALPAARMLTVYDTKGAQVFTQTFTNSVPFSIMKVDISRHAKGHYYIALKDASGKKIAEGSVEVF